MDFYVYLLSKNVLKDIVYLQLKFEIQPKIGVKYEKTPPKMGGVCGGVRGI